MVRNGILGLTGFYTKSFVLFLMLGSVLFAGYWYVWRGGLMASEIVSQSGSTQTSPYDLDLTLLKSGDLYLNNALIQGQTISSGSNYLLRWTVIDRPTQFVPELKIALHLPAPINEQAVDYQFVNNGGALAATSELVDPQTIAFNATGVGQNSQLAIELTVPKAYLQRSLLGQIREMAAAIPLAWWMGISIGLPLLAGLFLLTVLMARARRLPSLPERDAPPSRLKPAMVGILARGRLSSREIAATLIDLARRGHLIIRQVEGNEFRFRLRESNDALEDFEKELLKQFFWPGSQTTTEEISLTLGGHFSEQVSQAFFLAYQQIYQYGLFYRNPLSIHRRYQILGVSLFLVGLLGAFVNMFVFTEIRYSLFFWLGMMIAAMLINYLARRLPLRTTLGDQELARWVAFRQFLARTEPLHFQQASQDKYLAYLPYAIVLGAEKDWTKRLYDLPFATPDWYIAENIDTIDTFTAGVFPLFGYLSQALTESAQPATR